MKNKLFLSFSISEERTGKNRYFFLVPYGVVCVRYNTRMTPENRPLVFLSSFVGIKNPFFYY